MNVIMKIVTIFGSCRQHSIKNIYKCTNIQEDLTYPHYTKEVLQTIRYLKYKNLTDVEVQYTFRTPILNKSKLNYDLLKNHYNHSDVFIVEIASKLFYKYDNKFLHHISIEEQYNVAIKNDIEIGKLTKSEIENDILEIKRELEKPFIIVSHLVTRESGDRHELKCWLEEICSNNGILFLDPIKELKKKFTTIDHLFLDETVLAHYNDTGHGIIQNIYKEYIDQIL